MGDLSLRRGHSASPQGKSSSPGYVSLRLGTDLPGGFALRPLTAGMSAVQTSEAFKIMGGNIKISNVVLLL